jgi:chromosomal replication initiation ATPase DnaA
LTVWDQILEQLQAGMPEEDFRRWFGDTAYASDSSDQITVWVPSEPVRRHIVNNYWDDVLRAVEAIGRADTHVRFLVGGTDEDDEE